MTSAPIKDIFSVIRRRRNAKIPSPVFTAPVPLEPTPITLLCRLKTELIPANRCGVPQKQPAGQSCEFGGETLQESAAVSVCCQWDSRFFAKRFFACGNYPRIIGGFLRGRSHLKRGSNVAPLSGFFLPSFFFYRKKSGKLFGVAFLNSQRPNCQREALGSSLKRKFMQ